jgi:acyl carrier protein
MTDTADPQQTRAALQTVFRSVFADDSLVISDPMTAADVDGWDSLGHINLIIAVEKRFKIKFSTAEISRLKADGQNIGTFLQLVSGKLEKQA